MGREKNDRAPLTYDDDNIEKKLRRACIEGDLDTVKECLAEGADINDQNQQLNNSIHLASFYGKLDILQLLLQQDKAHINATNQNGQTSLQLACIKGYIEIVQQLVNTKKCQLDAATDASNMTALHLASKHGHASVCQYLLDVGADRNAKDLIEKLPEYYAANEETEEVFRINSDGDVSINHNEEKSSSKQQAVDRSKEVSEKSKVQTVEVKQEAPKKETKIEEKKIPERQKEQKKIEEKQPEKKKDDIAQPNNSVNVDKKSEVNETSKEAKQKESIEVKSEEIRQNNTTKSDQKNDKNPAIPKIDNKSKQESTDTVDSSGPGGLRKARNRSKNIGDPFHVEGVARLKIGAGQIRRGNFQKMKDHEFEWSDDFKKRQQLSVYDRLLGGAKKR
ncbi:DgyrCDS8048 [Dimorphilus gyrociliatus]|uniref:DgyrCDS8048 n=1 Tax=Dimorphilus gyrociliatus TaxID=2664684 RepID=A0A7I8VVA9_9ANNE|nr:DgyrCDS8048 [Dimorphilus gyrociliatus]